MSSPSRLGLSLSVVVLTAGALLAQDTSSLFDDGVAAFRGGDSAAAADAFKRVLAANPSNEDAYRLWQRAEDQVLREMLMDQGELGALAERFLGLARVGRRTVLADPGGAEEVVAALLDGDAAARQEALLTLQATYGEWAIPALVGPLGDRSDIDHRVQAIQALVRLGESATPALMQVLRSDDELTRTNAAAVLGTIKDPRAAAALAWMSSGDESATARTVAAEALGKLRPQLEAIGLGGLDATDLALGLAERWLVSDPDVIKPYASGQLSWRWEDGALAGKPILAGLHPLDLAEATLALAMENGGGDAVRVGLAAVHAAMKAEIEAASQVEALADSDLLASAAEMVPQLDVSLALAGSGRAGALALLLHHGRSPAARTLIAAMGNSPDERGALAAATGSRLPGVATAAAMALGAQGDASADVVARLGRAMTTVPDRLVVSIGQTGLGGEQAGWQLMATENVAEGLARAKAFPPKDVVVVRDGAQGVTLDTLVFSLRNDPRSADVPLIVVTDDVDGVEALYGDRVQAVVTGASFDDVAAAAGSADAQRVEAMTQARQAAEVLATLPPEAIRSAGGAVAQALAGGADAGVKIAALQVASRGAVTEAAGAVEALVLDDGDRDLQLAALHAASSLWAEMGGPAGDREALDSALRAALSSGDAELALAAAGALGQMGAVAL